MKANFQRVVGKINNPDRKKAVGISHVLRREGDSNPRYPFEVHTLSRRAN